MAAHEQDVAICAGLNDVSTRLLSVVRVIAAGQFTIVDGQDAEFDLASLFPTVTSSNASSGQLPTIRLAFVIAWLSV
jgi:hypothetical protein